MGVLATLAIIVALAVLSRTVDLHERLVRDATESYTPPRRQTHVPAPAPGSFGDAISPVLGRLAKGLDESKKQPPAVAEGCIGVRKGERAWGDRPPACEVELDAYGADLAAALRATHAERPDAPEGLSAMHARFWEKNAPSWGSVTFAARLAATDLSRRIFDLAKLPEADRERVNAAVVDECLDALALGRDASWSGGIIGRMIDRAVVGVVYPACAAAIDVVPIAEKRRALAGILSIRDATRTFDAVLDDEAVFARVALARAALSRKDLERLPAAAVALADHTPVELDGLARVVPALAWRTVEGQFAARRRAMILPENERGAALTRLYEADTESWNPLARELTSNLGFGYSRAARADALRNLLAFAAAAGIFRGEHGRWPAPTELATQLPRVDTSSWSVKEIDGRLEVALADEGDEHHAVLLSAPVQ